MGKLHAVNVYAGKDPRTMTFSITTLVIMMLCHYAECHCAECHCAECRDLFIVMRRYAECRYAECRGTPHQCASTKEIKLCTSFKMMQKKS
jgi:hypothetical protein